MQIYFNGTIRTMEAENHTAEAVLENNGKIVFAGSMEGAKKMADDSAVYVDLKGKTMMPAFIDGHGHIPAVAQLSTAVDLSRCEDHAQIIEALRSHMEKNHMGDGDVLLGYNYDHNFLPGEEHPVKKYLNQVSAVIPIYVLHASLHIGCVNDATLKMAGITEDTPDPEGGVIGRKEESREPSGYLEENGMKAVQAVFMPKVRLDLKKSMQMAQDMYLSNGITTVQDGAATEQTVKMVRTFADEGLLNIDVISYPLLDQGAREIFRDNKDCDGKYVNRYKLGGYKVVLDGSPQGKSAWLTKPYENSDGYCAYSWYPDEKVEGFMKAALEDGRQILAHCNGDAAGDQFLNAYEKALSASDRSAEDDLRPVMIHCQTARADQLDEMVKLHMIPSVFVGHVNYWGDVHYKNLGPERGSKISPCRWAFDRDLAVNFHQDTPVTRPDMLHSVWTVVNRITRNGVLLGGDQRCGVYDALKAATVNSAYAYFEEDRKGSISRGKLADLVILDRDPVKVPAMEIKDIQVLQTIKEGKVVFEA